MSAPVACFRRAIGACVRTIAVVGLAAAFGPVLAQGGPPMVTDDPETPGDGHWEINVAAIASRTPARREVAAPDVDINYGWGEHVQLKLDVPWVFAQDAGQSWKSGLGAGNFGVKWRFVDEEDAGFSASIYPQYTTRMLGSSTRRGIVAPGHQFFLPLEFATKVGGFGLDAEVGRTFGQDGANQWVAGVIAVHSCGKDRECMVELHHTAASTGSQTLANFGMHWKLSESLTFLAAAGREFGKRTDDQQQSLVYLGLQITR